ncbi:hypothetical protein COV24_00695 [candidate division WWE3 bacterium CG10_big_fil_rev_8_21_14_0_10_32_10]|uniref:Uncharacterized protein n=1 Tax=candidate division WWE3 bacterium CG10_big_fil_rev_8_21_14_0_10_32_10 TaxID=1975090 RepID=A0A2H0RBC1_UNCKA|nr:MAG: hypothetical protein COV24_00695 [candidate division WWE3 bacterium CG10_big_fil_rev_8_21_14_0_10_32_10]
MKKIFVINGLPGTGKTLFGQIISEILSRKSVDFTHTSSILPIKHIMLPKNKWDEAIIQKNYWEDLYKIRIGITKKDWDGTTKNVFWRKIMSEIKLLIVKNKPNFINNWILDQVTKLGKNAVVFVDIREPENIEALKLHVKNNFKNIQVKAVCIESDFNEDFDNYSDSSVGNYAYDIYVNNQRKGFKSEEEAKNNLQKNALEFVKKYII